MEIGFLKEEIEIRVESLKVELDNIKNKNFNKLHEYKEELKE